jgi:hypothetical protein
MLTITEYHQKQRIRFVCPRNFVCAQMENRGGFRKKIFRNQYSTFQASLPLLCVQYLFKHVIAQRRRFFVLSEGTGDLVRTW